MEFQLKLYFILNNFSYFRIAKLAMKDSEKIVSDSEISEISGISGISENSDNPVI